MGSFTSFKFKAETPPGKMAFFFGLSFFIYLSSYLSLYPSICLSLSLSVYLYVCVTSTTEKLYIAILISVSLQDTVVFVA